MRLDGGNQKTIEGGPIHRERPPHQHRRLMREKIDVQTTAFQMARGALHIVSDRSVSLDDVVPMSVHGWFPLAGRLSHGTNFLEPQ